MPDGFDNTWGIVRESGVSFVFIFTIPSTFVMYLTSPYFIFQPKSVHKLATNRRFSSVVSWRFLLNKGSGRT